MKRYLFLKLCLTIFCYTSAASGRSEVSENKPRQDESRLAREDLDQVVAEIEDGDTKNVIKNYQGVMGKPGVDFPVLTYIPRTSFTCRGMKSGYYADLDTNCQVFHICDEGRKVSFLCPNGTIFQQSDLICDWWFKVDCASSPLLYEESAEQLQEDNHKRKEARKQYELKRAEESRQKLQHIESRSEERPTSRESSSREFLNHRRQSTNRVIDQNNIAKKDVNNFEGNFGETEQKPKKPEKVYKETQVLAETASFVNKKFEQPYFKNVNDVAKFNYLPQRTHADNRQAKTATEKPNRGGKSYENTSATVKPYRGRNNEYLKTTTQHTIYSPTVPPITATKYTTKIPATKSIQTTTEFFRQKQTILTTTTELPTTRYTEPTRYTETTRYTEPTTTKPPGFYITKVVDSTTNHPSSLKLIGDKIFGERETTVRPAATKSTETTTPKKTRDLDKSFTNYDFTKYDFNSNRRSTTPSPNYSTTPYRTTFTTITPTGFFSTLYPETTTEKQTTLDDKPTTYRFSQYTYLPNSEGQSTARPTSPTPYTAYTTPPSVKDNLSNMIKTLQNLDSQDPSIDIEKLLVSRPGLNIPPSVGPNTLHSLAVYFATALDNLVANETETERSTTTEPAPSTITEEDSLVTLLSRSTVDKYNLLFNENQEEKENGHENLDIKSLVEHDSKYNDLDVQQSQGPLGATPRIRQLAQVFTQALSAYLDDPETFKRVLEEIRPTEPPHAETEYDINTESSQTPTEYSSYTKEEDEVLDFSDSDKSTLSTASTTTPAPRTTEQPFLNEISTSYPDDRDVHRDSRAQTINTLAVDLNDNLRYATPTPKEESTTRSSYLPVDNENNEDAQKRLTAKPYGFGVKPSDSTPITEIPQTSNSWNTISSNQIGNRNQNNNFDYNLNKNRFDQINTNLSEFQPFDALLPPFQLSQKSEYNHSKTYRDEYLQSAHSQSFISHGNSIVSDRKGKSAFGSETTTDKPRTEALKYTTVQADISTTPFYPEETTTDSYFTISDSTTTTEESTTTDSTTNYPTTQTYIPNNHWSQSPIVTKLWETTLYINPLIINRNLDTNNDYNNSSAEDISTTTENYELNTQNYKTTTDSRTTDYKTTADYRTTDYKTTADYRTTDYKTTDYRTTDNYRLADKYRTTTDFSRIRNDFGRATTDRTDGTTTDSEPTTTNFPEIFTNYNIPQHGINNLLNTTELEIASSQANQLFGNLDLSEQDLLMEKMKMAESNSTVRRLILLLVSTCDASLNQNKTVQETRNYILHALLGIPLNKTEESKHKETVQRPSTTQEPIDLVQQPSQEPLQEPLPVPQHIKSRTGKALKDENHVNSVTTDVPQENTTVEILTSSKSYTITERKTKPQQVPNKELIVKNVHQNTRALELLRSLYSLAAKWSNK